MYLARRIVGLILLSLLTVVLSKCTKKAPLVTLPPQPQQKHILIPIHDTSRVGAPIWIQGHKYYPLSGFKRFVQYGMASWYGPKFHGRKTSSGEIYNMYGRTAAHRTLPLGTYTQVENLSNGRQTVVRINDRGPFVKNRIIDLSYGAARQIGLVGPGVGKVKLTILGRQAGLWESPTGPSPILEVPDIRQGAFAVQVGAFTDRNNAANVAYRLKVLFEYVEVVPGRERGRSGSSIYRVRISRLKTLQEANRIRNRLKRLGFEEAFVVSL